MCKGCHSYTDLTPPSMNGSDPNSFNPCANDDCGNPCDDCAEGCKQQLDPNCIIYGLNDPSTADLTGIGASVGSTLQEILEVINSKESSNNPLDISSFSLPYLRSKYNILTLKNFAEAVDRELEDLREKLLTPVSNPSTNLCFTFTIINNTSTAASYTMRNCNGLRVNNILIGPGSRVIVTAQGVSSSSTSLVILNNGIV